MLKDKVQDSTKALLRDGSALLGLAPTRLVLCYLVGGFFVTDQWMTLPSSVGAVWCDSSRTFVCELRKAEPGDRPPWARRVISFFFFFFFFARLSLAYSVPLLLCHPQSRPPWRVTWRGESSS